MLDVCIIDMIDSTYLCAYAVSANSGNSTSSCTAPKKRVSSVVVAAARLAAADKSTSPGLKA
jgi:hypothetical protein